MARLAIRQTRRYATRALTLKQRIDEAVEPTAIRVGWLGLWVLFGCLMVSIAPVALWPRALTPQLLLTIGVVALVCASFLGWAAVRRGQERIKRRLHRHIGLLVFAILPVGCALISLIHDHVVRLWSLIPPGHDAWIVIGWYIPTIVAVSLLSFVTWRARLGRRIRRKELAWALAVIAPYVLLCAVMVWGTRIPGIDANLQAGLATLGEWAVVLQLALAWFVG